jgi:hypothetical protein
VLAGVRCQAASSLRVGRGQRRQAVTGSTPAWEGEQGGAGDPALPGLRPEGGSPPSEQGGAGDPAPWELRVGAGLGAERTAAVRSAQEVSWAPGGKYPPHDDRRRKEACPLKVGARKPLVGRTCSPSGAAPAAAHSAQAVWGVPRGEYPLQDDPQREEAGLAEADAMERPAGQTRWLSAEARSAEEGEPRAVIHLAPRQVPQAPAAVAMPAQAPRSSPRAAGVFAGVGCCRAGAAAQHSLAGCPLATDAQVCAEAARGCHRSVGSAAGRRSGGAHREPVGLRPACLLKTEARRRPAGQLEAQAGRRPAGRPEVESDRRCAGFLLAGSDRRLAGRLGPVSLEAAVHPAKGAWAPAAWRHAQRRRRFPDGSRHLPRRRRQLLRARAPRRPRSPWAGPGTAPGGKGRECSGRDLMEWTGKLHSDDLRVRRQTRRFQ